jgi:CO/xanthine dehydrogenase FAD-binding subunit
MISARPNNLNEALKLLAEKPKATIVAGGTDVMIWLKNKKLQTDFILDVSNINELKKIDNDNGKLFIGASLTIADIIRLSKILNIPQGFVKACEVLGSPAVRNIATVGGNLGTSSPAGDISTALLGLRAEVVIKRASQTLVVPLNQFFLGPGKNILASGDLIVGVIIPRSLTSRYIKLGLRKSMFISIVSVAGSLYEKDDGSIGLCLGLGAVAPSPIRAIKTESLFSLDNTSNLKEYGQLAASEVSPISDLRASAQYRRSMVEALVPRLITQMINDISPLGNKMGVI